MKNIVHQFCCYRANYVFVNKREIRKNKTNHPISSNSYPSATANKAIHSLKIGGSTKPTGTSYNFDKKVTKQLMFILNQY